MLVVAGTHSGCGKTSVALGLMRALTRRGLTVQAFKAGPDFIDPSLHTLATSRPSWNLDSWMCPPHALWCAVGEAVRQHGKTADLCIVEGVMGLHDGASATSSRGSTAELARLLDAHILLVADVRSMARSAAALVHGYTQLEPGLTFAGVACNRVGSANHRSLLQESLEWYCHGLPIAGMLGRDDEIALPSRHLGLVTGTEGAVTTAHLDRLAHWVEEGLDLDALLQRLPPSPLPVMDQPQMPTPPARIRLAVARDAAFCFVYEENLQRLRQAGAALEFFSPLTDAALPAEVQGCYLPGGYPELHAQALAENTAMRQSMQAFAHSGRPVYAECGGFMYLMEQLIVDGEAFPMAGVFPVAARMGQRFSALGYREVVTTEASLLGPAGTRCRGHEFHYSHLEDVQPLDAAAQQVYRATDRKGALLAPEKAGGWRRGAVLGSYIHLHFASNPHLAASFVDACATA